MNINRYRGPRQLRMRIVTLGVGLVGCLAFPSVAWASPAGTSTPTSASARSAPQLSIAVDDGHTSVATGDALAYTITVTNLGATDIAHLTVTQTVPTGLRFSSADPAGLAHAGDRSWRVSLAASAQLVMHTKMTVAATPKDLLRLATVACAQVSADGPPLVCASHSDELPAGAAAARRAAPARAAASSATSPVWWYAGAVLLLLLAGLGMVLAVRRRTGRSA